MRYLSQSLVSDVVRREPKPVNTNQDMVFGELRRIGVRYQHRRDLRLGESGQPWYGECQVVIGHGQAWHPPRRLPCGVNQLASFNRDQLTTNAGQCHRTSWTKLLIFSYACAMGIAGRLDIYKMVYITTRFSHPYDSEVRKRKRYRATVIGSD